MMDVQITERLDMTDPTVFTSVMNDGRLLTEVNKG